MLAIATGEFARDGFAVGAPFGFNMAKGFVGCDHVPLAVAVAHDSGVITAFTWPILADGWDCAGCGAGLADVNNFVNAVGQQRVYLGGVGLHQVGEGGFRCVLHGVSPSVGDTMG